MQAALRVIAVLAVMAVSAVAPAFAQDWAEYKPAGVGYRVEMPGAPKITVQDAPTAIGPIKTTLAIVQRGNVAFIVGHNDYPPQAIAGRPLDDVLDGIVRGQVGQNTLRDQQKITISERPGRSAIIDTAQGQVIVTRAVMVETRLYQAIFVGPKGSETGEDAGRFLGSFVLVER
jgi:hypothetical protein